MSSHNKEDYIWACQRALNLLRADTNKGALALLPAGGIECEALVAKAVFELTAILEPDDLPETES